MKCEDCKMFERFEGCHADPGKDCDQIEYEMAVEMAEYCKMHEPTYNSEDGSM